MSLHDLSGALCLDSFFAQSVALSWKAHCSLSNIILPETYLLARRLRPSLFPHQLPLSLSLNLVQKRNKFQLVSVVLISIFKPN